MDFAGILSHQKESLWLGTFWTTEELISTERGSSGQLHTVGTCKHGAWEVMISVKAKSQGWPWDKSCAMGCRGAILYLGAYGGASMVILPWWLLAGCCSGEEKGSYVHFHWVWALNPTENSDLSYPGPNILQESATRYTLNIYLIPPFCSQSRMNLTIPPFTDNINIAHQFTHFP